MASVLHSLRTTNIHALCSVSNSFAFTGSTWKSGNRKNTSKSSRHVSRKRRCSKMQALQKNKSIDEQSTATIPSDVVARYAGKKAIVVGASMAGVIAAAYLAKQGFDVKVYERREDPTEKGYSRTNAALIRILPDAVATVRDAGVHLPYDGYRNGVHRLKGGAFPASFEKLQYLQFPGNLSFSPYIGEGNQFMEIFVEDVREKWSDSVTFFYNQRCANIDFDKKQAVFEENGGSSVVEQYDLLIAADGAQSFVRQKLQQYDSTFEVRSYQHYGSYKSIRDLPFLSEEEKVMKGVRPGFGLFIGNGQGLVFDDSGIGQAFFSFFRTSEEETIHSTIVAKTEVFEEIKGREREWLKGIAPSYFPKQWLDDISQKMSKAATIPIPTINELSRLYGPSTILIGDAGHSATPAMALGANTALTDAKVLYEALEKAEGNVDAVGEIFNDIRWTDIRALQDLQMVLEYPAFSLSFLDNWRSFVGWVHLDVVRILRNVFPSRVTPKLYTRVDQGMITPRQALDIAKRDAVIFSVASIILLALLAEYVLVPVVQPILS